MHEENVYEPIDHKAESTAAKTRLTLEEDDLASPGEHRATFVKAGGD